MPQVVFALFLWIFSTQMNSGNLSTPFVVEVKLESAIKRIASVEKKEKDVIISS